MATSIWIVIFIISIWILSYHRASLKVWTVSFLVLLLLQSNFSTAGWFILSLEWILFIPLATLLNSSTLRQQFLIEPILKFYKKQQPHLSETEREALTAGTVTWEGDLFQGNPDWSKWANFPTAKLSSEEEAFLAGPVEEVCRMTQDWDVTYNLADLTPEVWQFLKTQGFFGLIIPKQYGGKEFSASAHSAILAKLYGHSATLGSTVAVPNSLGPAELLLHYGTAEQKKYYLPRLALGEEIPCFALTNPEAGSDASSIPDYGVVCYEKLEGKKTLGIRLNWDKRYITLAPVATVLGLAFKLYDPDHLLGKNAELGITCALIPTTTPGIHIGRRHLPLSAPFQNGPTQGKDVFIPLDWIIGGVAMAGQGWRMLVECLSVGRSISLPASALGNAKVMTYASGAYARIRKQFNLPIGYFEGIQKLLARVAGHTYMIDAVVKFTLAAIDRGEKPAVPSAILKYHSTEQARHIIKDAMDIHAGKGICLGPKNYLGRSYQTAPISITVEGANILTRNLIIFGQGAIRCHPYALAELEAANDPDDSSSIKKFDQALFGHLGYTISNVFRTLFLSLTGGWLVKVSPSPIKRYQQQITRYSAAFALLADFSMLLLRSDLKRKENISARLGDILSMLYIGSAVLKCYAEQKYPEADGPLVAWAIQEILFTTQQKFIELLRNYPNRFAAACLHLLIFPYGHHLSAPSDHLGHEVAELILSINETRQRLTNGIYNTPDANNPIGFLDEALAKVTAAEAAEKLLSHAIHAGKLNGRTLTEQTKKAVATGLLTQQQADEIMIADAARKLVIAVDDFAPEDLVNSERKEPK